MGMRIKQIVVYMKIGVILAILGGVAAVVVMNRGYKTRFWPLADAEEVSTLWLILATSIVSVILFWVFSRMRRVFKELAQLRAEQEALGQQAAQEKLKKDLAEQERRIDNKIKKALQPDETDSASGA